MEGVVPGDWDSHCLPNQPIFQGPRPPRARSGWSGTRLFSTSPPTASTPGSSAQPRWMSWHSHNLLCSLGDSGRYRGGSFRGCDDALEKPSEQGNLSSEHDARWRQLLHRLARASVRGAEGSSVATRPHVDHRLARGRGGGSPGRRRGPAAVGSVRGRLLPAGRGSPRASASGVQELRQFQGRALCRLEFDSDAGLGRRLDLARRDPSWPGFLRRSQGSPACVRPWRRAGNGCGPGTRSGFGSARNASWCWP